MIFPNNGSCFDDELSSTGKSITSHEEVGFTNLQIKTCTKGSFSQKNNPICLFQVPNIGLLPENTDSCYLHIHPCVIVDFTGYRSNKSILSFAELLLF